MMIRWPTARQWRSAMHRTEAVATMLSVLGLAAAMATGVRAAPADDWVAVGAASVVGLAAAALVVAVAGARSRRRRRQVERGLRVSVGRYGGNGGTGTNGTNGTNGMNGMNGTDGINGTNGVNGVGGDA